MNKEEKKVYLTQEGVDELKKQLDELKNVKRPEVIIALKEARALGDLSENAEYDAARTEQALVEGKIQELNYGKAQSHFDGNADPHYHFVCEKCGRILDIPLEGKGLSQDLLAAVPGKVTGHRLECYGICENCLEKTNH